MRLCWRCSAAVKLLRQRSTGHSFTYPVVQRRSVSDSSEVDATNIDSNQGTKTPFKPLSDPNRRANNVAVIGGGVTGLATAYNLAKELPNARVTLFDAHEKLGGWLDSEIVPVDGGEVLFEWGPRTLRTDLYFGSGRYTAQLIAQLDMTKDIIPTWKYSPAALNRYIYYPDHLVRMPAPLPGANILTNILRNVTTVFQEPIFKGIVKGVINELSVAKRSPAMRDESVGSFISRRFGQPVADNLVSPLLHGIYAGDLYKLSMKTLFPLIWHLEESSDTGIMGASTELSWWNEKLIPLKDKELIVQSDATSKIPRNQMADVEVELNGSSVFTFKGGLRQFAAAIERDLRKNKNVSIKQAKAEIAFDSATAQFQITAAKAKENTKVERQTGLYDYVVAAIPPEQISKALKEKDPTHPTLHTDLLCHLLADHSDHMPPTVDVMVVNLFFSNPNLVPVNGFGYLIPRSVPLDQNPERALGVIFGSETSGGSASASTTAATTQDTTPGTKLTVMLGGHWWDSWPRSSLPDTQSAIQMSLSLLQRHLGITDPPILAKARMQWNAIPQYRVGHHDRMARLHDHLLRAFGGRLKVAGSAYHGVGVNDCVKVARKVSLDIREGRDATTGLEGFADDGRDEWAVLKKEEHQGSSVWRMTDETR